MAATAFAPNVVSATTPVSTTNTATSGTNGTLAGNFQTFLTLLTTQLQNQNPLDPLDTNQFTQQLVQFAGVEQQLKQNEQLSALVSLQQSTQATQALNFVGKTAVVDGNTTTLANNSATWSIETAKDANVNITITNAAGQTVYTGTSNVTAGSGQYYTWDGHASDGSTCPPGAYKISVTAKDTAGNSVAVNTQVKGEVSSVDLTSTPPLLVINGQTYTMSQIRAIVTPATPVATRPD